jgi:acetoin utilization deacetylase AcuC-like enzyme
MGQTGLVLDGVFQGHRAGFGHPERPERIQRIIEVFSERRISEQCRRIEPLAAEVEAIARLHSPDYAARVREACAAGDLFIDTPDSGICRESYDIALLAAGSVLTAVDQVMGGSVSNAFCAVRPPGHHAERGESMGFCLFGNVALAVQHLRERHGVRKVLILDFDVHHGNGTQHLLEEDPDAMFISIHGDPRVVYPGTGFAEERGVGAGLGATLNVPMPAHSGDRHYREAFDKSIRGVLDSFAAEFVLVSAGFDAHRLDPLAPIELETESFGWMTEMILDAADTHCGRRLVSVLEGGYHLDALAESAALHVSLLMERAARPG